jgi:hypothetical protein
VDLRIQCVVVDNHDCGLLPLFWSEALGWRITLQDEAEWAIEPPEGDPAVDVAPDILFVKVPDQKITNEPAPFRPSPEESELRSRPAEAPRSAARRHRPR